MSEWSAATMTFDQNRDGGGVEDDPAARFPLLVDLVRELAEAGLGAVLGARANRLRGVVRVSRRAQQETTDRFATTYRERYPMLLRYARGKVGEPTRAEDVVQRAFEKVWNRLQQDGPEIDNLDAYLVTTVSREINNELRTVITARERYHEAMDNTLEAIPSQAPEVATRVADVLIVRKLLDRLAPREREAVVLRLQCQLSVAETAEIMGLSPGAVKRYTYDGLATLRHELMAS